MTPKKSLLYIHKQVDDRKYEEMFDFACDLVRDHAFSKDGFDYDLHIATHKKEQLAGMYLDYDKRDSEFIHENDRYDDIISSFLVCLKKDKIDENLDFVGVLKESLVEYYDKRLRELCERAVRHEIEVYANDLEMQHYDDDQSYEYEMENL